MIKSSMMMVMSLRVLFLWTPPSSDFMIMMKEEVIVMIGTKTIMKFEPIIQKDPPFYRF